MKFAKCIREKMKTKMSERVAEGAAPPPKCTCYQMDYFCPFCQETTMQTFGKYECPIHEPDLVQCGFCGR